MPWRSIRFSPAQEPPWGRVDQFQFVCHCNKANQRHHRDGAFLPVGLWVTLGPHPDEGALVCKKKKKKSSPYSRSDP